MNRTWLNNVSRVENSSTLAELGASRLEETIRAAGLRDAAIGTGIAVDKLLALTGQLASVQIANVVLPTPQEDAQRRAIDAKLDEITALLNAPAPAQTLGSGERSSQNP